MATILCPHCGKRIPGKSKICPHCGQKVHDSPLGEPIDFSDSSNIKKIITLVVISAILISIIVTFTTKKARYEAGEKRKTEYQAKKPEPPKQSHKVRNKTRGKYPACISEDLLDQFTSAMNQKDNRSIKYLLNHGCIITKPGVPISVLDLGMMGVSKIRAYTDDGNAVVLYTFSENVFY